MIKEWTSHMCNGIFFPAFSSLITWGLWSPGKSIWKISRKQHWRKTLRMAIQRDCLFSVSWNVLRFFSVWPKISFVYPQSYGVCLENIYCRKLLSNTIIIEANSVTDILWRAASYSGHMLSKGTFFCWEMLCHLKSIRTTLHL